MKNILIFPFPVSDQMSHHTSAIIFFCLTGMASFGSQHMIMAYCEKNNDWNSSRRLQSLACIYMGSRNPTPNPHTQKVTPESKLQCDEPNLPLYTVSASAPVHLLRPHCTYELLPDCLCTWLLTWCSLTPSPTHTHTDRTKAIILSTIGTVISESL